MSHPPVQKLVLYWLVFIFSFSNTEFVSLPMDVTIRSNRFNVFLTRFSFLDVVHLTLYSQVMHLKHFKESKDSISMSDFFVN